MQTLCNPETNHVWDHELAMRLCSCFKHHQLCPLRYTDNTPSKGPFNRASNCVSRQFPAGASARTERGVSPEATGAQVAVELAGALSSGSCVDQWAQDQLIIFMALAKGTPRMLCSSPTLHTRTAMVIAEQMLPGVKFRLKRLQGGGGAARVGTGSTSGGLSVVPHQAKVQEEAGFGATGNATACEEGGLWLVECDGAGLVAGLPRAAT